MLGFFLLLIKSEYIGQAYKKGGMDFEKDYYSHNVVILTPRLRICISPLPTGAFSSQQIQRGAFGDDVIELQLGSNILVLQRRD